MLRSDGATSWASLVLAKLHVICECLKVLTLISWWIPFSTHHRSITFPLPPIWFPHCPADHNKDRLINLGWVCWNPLDRWQLACLFIPLRNFGCLLVFVPVPSFHLLNNMSVVAGFVTRNRYSTEASEWGKEDARILNLIYSKCVCAYTRVSKCIHVSLLQLGSIQPCTAEPSH